VDVEGSTRRENSLKEELREQVYRLLLGGAGRDERHCDPFTDYSDGALVLIHPADELPKPLLPMRLITALRGLREQYNDSISPPSSRVSCGSGRSCTRGWSTMAATSSQPLCALT
jgi:hypothetical protein